MKLYDIYKHKEENELIQINSFATRMNSHKELIIVFSRMEKHNDYEIGHCPSFNGYGTQEEIEKEYELFIKQEDLDKYEDWNEIFKLLERKSENK